MSGTMPRGRECPWPMGTLRGLRGSQERNATRVREGDREVVVSEVYFPSAEYLGRPTRAFGYYARPAEAREGPVPGMVLIHGGGGTADAWWARYWAGRGFAALAMDLYGHGPDGQRLPDGGPDWSDNGASFRLTHGLENCWIYQAVGTCLASVTALSGMPEVDPARIGVTGISWGGYFCSTVMSIDDRIGMGMPMFGCGFSPRVATGSWLTEEDGRRQREAFEPGNFLPACRKPVLWVNSTSDGAARMDELQKSASVTPGPNWRCIPAHPGHTDVRCMGLGWREEMVMFANQVFRGGAPLPVIGRPQVEGDEIRATYESPLKPGWAVVHWTTEFDKPWIERTWQAARADVLDGALIRAKLPGTRPIAAFVNATDARGAMVSSEYVELAP